MSCDKLQLPVIFWQLRYFFFHSYLRSQNKLLKNYIIISLGSQHFKQSMFQNNQNRHLQRSLNPETGKKIKNYVYEYRDLIGKGNFAKVYKGHNLNNQQIVAIKLISLDELKCKHLEALVFEEIKILQMMNHSNILQFVEALLSERNCYLVTQLCNEGSLDDRIKNKKPLSDIQLGNIILDLFKGLKYLRQKGVIHRDFKPANIFIKNGKMKIADFGLAKFYKQRFHDLDIGSPQYMSPEGLILNCYSQKTDIWSFGITIYELLHGTTPFIHCRSQQELIYSITQPIPEHKWRRDMDPMLRQMLYKLLEIDEFKRPNIFQLANEPYIKMLVERQKQRNAQLQLTRSISFCGFMNFDEQQQKPAQRELAQFAQLLVRNQGRNQKTENEHLYSTKGSQNSLGQQKSCLQSTNSASMKYLLQNTVDQSNKNRYSFAKMNIKTDNSVYCQDHSQSHRTTIQRYSLSEGQNLNRNQNQIYQLAQNHSFSQNTRHSTSLRYQQNRQQLNNTVFVYGQLFFS